MNVFANQEMAAKSTEVSSMAGPLKSFSTQDVRLIFPKDWIFLPIVSGKTFLT